MQHCLGIDIGGSSVKLAALRDGQVAFTGQSGFYSRPDRQELIEAIRSISQAREIEAEAVGICVPGLLDESRTSVTLSVNVPGLVGLRLDELVAASLGRSIKSLQIINDALAAGSDIVISRQLKGRVLAMALGTGVGMTVLDDGRPLLVEGASPGHIGQIDVSLDSDSPVGPDGGAGSLEAYIGVPALTRAYGNTAAFFKTATATDGPLRALARAIRICHAIYRPQHVVLVGGVGIRLKRLIPDLRDAVNTNITSIAREGWTLGAGDHDFHAAIGAARIASSTA